MMQLRTIQLSYDCLFGIDLLYIVVSYLNTIFVEVTEIVAHNARIRLISLESSHPP